MAVSAPEPVAPTNNSFVKRSRISFTRASFRATQTVVSRSGLPSQFIFSGVELHAVASKQRLEGNAAIDEADHRAVSGRQVVELVHQQESARAWNVLNDDAGTTGEMIAEMLRDGTAPNIVGAARTEPDQDADGLAGKGGLGLRCPQPAV